MKRGMHRAWLVAALGVMVGLSLPPAAQAAPAAKRSPRPEAGEVALHARDAEGSVLALRVPAGILLAQLQQQGSGASTNLNQIGGASVSASLYDGPNTALKVNCVVGCSAAGGFTDNSAFTAGTSAETNIGGVYNDVLAAVTSGNAAAARITSSRALHANLRNASGTEIGTASNPIRTDPTGTTTQPVSGTVTGNQGAAAALAGAWPVKVTDGTNSMPTGDVAARTIHVTADNASIPVAESGTWTVQPGNTANTTPWLTTDSADGNTGSAVPAKAGYLGGNASGNLTGITICDHWTPVSLTANTQIIAGSASKQTYICSINLVAGAATNVALVEGTGTVCATGIAGLAGGTTAAAGWNFAANGGIAQGTGIGAILRTATAADNVCILVSAANQVSGALSWTQF